MSATRVPSKSDLGELDDWRAGFVDERLVHSDAMLEVRQFDQETLHLVDRLGEVARAPAPRRSVGHR